jgi:hypothetical protein
MVAILQNRRLLVLFLLLALLVLLATIAALHALPSIAPHHLQGLADGPDVIVHNH